MTLRAALLSLPLLVSCRTTSPVPVSVPVPANLEELLSQYSAQVGVNITYDDQTAVLLEAIEIKLIGPSEASMLLIVGPSKTR